MFVQCLAGSALGLLLGLLVGLSASPVVATVVGAVAGGLMLLLGFNPKGADPATNDQSTRASAFRLAGFGLCGALALLAGLYLRTHNLFSPTVAQQVAELTSTGFTPDEAHAWVAYKNAGLQLRGAPSTFNAAAAAADAKSAGNTVLFASHGTDACLLFDPARSASPAEQLNSLRSADPKYNAFVHFAEGLDPGGLAALLQSTKPLFCAAP